MSDDGGKQVESLSSPEEVANRLRDLPDENALIQFNHDSAKAYFDVDVEAAAFWLVVFARWRGLRPTPRMRALLEGLLDGPAGAKLH